MTELAQTPEAEAQIQHELAQTPQGQRLLQRRAVRRLISGTVFFTGTALFLLWLPQESRESFLRSLVINRFLLALMFLFSLLALSLLWSRGQALDVWLFKGLHLDTTPPYWMDRMMWVLTQIGNVGFALIVAVGAYILNYHRFALGFALGSLTLLLLVTIAKAMTDRARPFNLMKETRVVGYREAGLSFPSGHTTQSFFMVTLAVLRFQLPLAVAAVLYGFAVLVGITRVYLGVHYPRDVVAGAILGIIWGNMGALVAPYL